MATNNSMVMMTNKKLSIEDLVAAYYALGITIVGTVLNLSTFIILCQPAFRDTKTRPTIHYMRAMAIFDILMLYGWNLDHYCSTIHGFRIQTLNIPFCRFFSFLNYFAAQSSAWFRVFVCVDRYLSMRYLHRTWFSQSNHVLFIIGFIIGGFTLLNGQFFIVGCSYQTDGSITRQSLAFETYPLWDNIQFGVYNCVPFVLMVTLNSLIIYNLVQLKRSTTIQNSRIQHQAISITLVITTSMFLVMTVPVNICYGFFYSVTPKTLLDLLGGLMYTYHILSFPLYMITLDEFRHELFALILCQTQVQHVHTQNRAAAPVSLNGIKTFLNAETKT